MKTQTLFFKIKPIFFFLLFFLCLCQSLPIQAETDANGLDPRLYIYYAQLSGEEQMVYAQALEIFSSGVSSFSPDRVISLDSASRIMHAICKDQPQLFWLKESFQYEYRTHLTGQEEVTSIQAECNDLADDLEEHRSQLEARRDALIGDLYDLPAWQQEKYVHDRLLSQTSYNSESSYNQSVYSALCLQETVCAGYARAFQYLMTCLGVPCYYCEGTAAARFS